MELFNTALKVFVVLFSLVLHGFYLFEDIYTLWCTGLNQDEKTNIISNISLQGGWIVLYILFFFDSFRYKAILPISLFAMICTNLLLHLHLKPSLQMQNILFLLCISFVYLYLFWTLSNKKTPQKRDTL